MFLWVSAQAKNHHGLFAHTYSTAGFVKQFAESSLVSFSCAVVVENGCPYGLLRVIFFGYAELQCSPFHQISQQHEKE
jgi:hypothetical protein